MSAYSKRRLERIRNLINGNVEPVLVSHKGRYCLKRGYQVFNKVKSRWVPLFTVEDMSDVLLTIEAKNPPECIKFGVCNEYEKIDSMV